MPPSTQVSRTVLVTGAAGNVGRILVPYLAESYDLRLHSRTSPIANADRFQTVYGDIQDYDFVSEMVQSVDAIVHLAGVAQPRSAWDEVKGPNIDGTYNVFEAARLAGVGKIVFASTNHVTGFYDRNREWPVRPDLPVRPDSYYAVTKAFGEALARYYADEFGISVICLRIGWVLERPHNDQAMWMYLSPRDLAQLVVLAIECPQRFGVYYGRSDNSRAVWSIDNARADLGYAPQDDSEDFIDSVPGPSSGARPSG